MCFRPVLNHSQTLIGRRFEIGTNPFQDLPLFQVLIHRLLNIDNNDARRMRGAPRAPAATRNTCCERTRATDNHPEATATLTEA